MVTFKELLKLDDAGKKIIIIAIGLSILVFIHAIDLIIVYWAVKYSNLDAFIIAVITMMLGDLIGIGIWITKVVFKITPTDMDKIKIDDVPKTIPQ